MPLRGYTIRFMDIYKFIQLDTTQFPYRFVGKNSGNELSILPTNTTVDEGRLESSKPFD